MTQHSGRTLRRPFPRFAPRPLVHALAACALLTLWPGTQAQTLPSGLRTASGQARVSTSGNTMTVTNTASAILNWQSFNIGAGSSVRFQQPNASSKVLNRVTGTDPSSIFGSLTSNGSVWLLNPNGVLFGKGARVDVGSLVASTLDLSDADWLAGRYGLTTGPGDKGAGVTNLGDLQTAFGGRIALLGDDVTNEGSIDASGGQVLLAAGKSIDLVDTGTPNLAVHVQAPAGQVLNLGTLIADGGRVDIQAAMVNQEGVVRANALSHGPAGEIVLTATQALTLAAGSVTEAEGTAGGGKVALDAGAGGTTLVSGKVSVASSAGTGGQVVALGQHVGLLDGSRVDASGAAGGGEILVGGGDRGQDVRYRDAEAVYMSPDAEVAADALQRGNGGHIVLWSNDATRAYGSFSARGGPGGGDGGHIETSGGWLDARPAFISTAAPAGKPGQWLLDPWNIEIVGGNDVVGFVDDGQNFTSVDPKGQASISQIGVGTIASALQTGNVTITTGIDPGSNGAGDITMTGVTMDFTKSVITAATPATLTLNAQRNITLSGATIESTVDGTLNVVLNAAQSGIGAVSLSDASAIIVPGGQVVLGGASQLAGPHGNQPSFLGAMGYSNNSSDFEQYGVSITGKSVIDTGSTGTIDINGSSISTLGQAGGVDIEGSTLTARTINIQGWVDSPAATAGVSVSGSTLGAWNQMTVTGTAQAGGNGADHAVSGTNIATSILVAGSEESDEAASLTIQGTATVDTLSTSQPRYGVSIDGGSSGTVAVFGKGHLSITGTVTSPGDDSLVQSVHYASAPTAFGIFGDDGSDVSIVGNGSRQVSIAGNILGSLDDHGGTILLQSGGTLGLANAGVESAGKIQLQGVKVSLGQATEVVSGYNDGTSILVSGPDKDEVTTFINSAGSDALTTVPGGRWLIYAATPDSASFQPDGLDNAFRQYNAPYQTTPAASGNGFLFKLAPTYTLDGPTKTYDGNTAITLTSDNVHVHGLVGGDLADLASSAASNFTATDPATAKNAGTDKPIDLPEGFVVQITDASGKPVYGYGVGPLTGTIEKKEVSVAITATDKTYDGKLDANVSYSLTGLVGPEQLAVSGDAAFANQNVQLDPQHQPAQQTVTAKNIAIADGNNGGLASNYTLDNSTASASAKITPKIGTASCRASV
ncbi:MAG: filamentous hemagglutinin N-terminal domain-containing protein [Proteobacteria bacterium]|nr:filamentous hemagglutinin N-terminal domain-containing protein [Pseudomonadota bacterium]